jgi:hypothetical protein
MMRRRRRRMHRITPIASPDTVNPPRTPPTIAPVGCCFVRFELVMTFVAATPEAEFVDEDMRPEGVVLECVVFEGIMFEGVVLESAVSNDTVSGCVLLEVVEVCDPPMSLGVTSFEVELVGGLGVGRFCVGE